MFTWEYPPPQLLTPPLPNWHLATPRNSHKAFSHLFGAFPLEKAGHVTGIPGLTIPKYKVSKFGLPRDFGLPVEKDG